MEIKRDHYLDILLAHRWNGLVKVITGIRRCGKSYLLFQLFKKHLIAEGVSSEDIIEIKLEEIGSIQFRDPIALYDHVESTYIQQSSLHLIFHRITSCYIILYVT